MRNGALFCAMLLVLAGCAGASASRLPPAAAQPTPMEAANQVIVRTTNAPSAAFDRMAALVGRTYLIDTKNPAEGTFVTQWKEVEGQPMRVRAEVEAVPTTFESAERTKITLTGETRAVGRVRPVRHEGAAGAVIRGHFGELDALARAYPRGRVLYARQ